LASSGADPSHFAGPVTKFGDPFLQESPLSVGLVERSETGMATPGQWRPALAGCITCSLCGDLWCFRCSRGELGEVMGRDELRARGYR
jgi:hypothetical protein